MHKDGLSVWSLQAPRACTAWSSRSMLKWCHDENSRHHVSMLMEQHHKVGSKLKETEGSSNKGNHQIKKRDMRAEATLLSAMEKGHQSIRKKTAMVGASSVTQQKHDFQHTGRNRCMRMNLSAHVLHRCISTLSCHS